MLFVMSELVVVLERQMGVSLNISLWNPPNEGQTSWNASGYFTSITHNKKVLLIFHSKLHKYLQMTDNHGIVSASRRQKYSQDG